MIASRNEERGASWFPNPPMNASRNDATNQSFAAGN